MVLWGENSESGSRQTMNLLYLYKLCCIRVMERAWNSTWPCGSYLGSVGEQVKDGRHDISKVFSYP